MMSTKETVDIGSGRKPLVKSRQQDEENEEEREQQQQQQQTNDAQGDDAAAAAAAAAATQEEEQQQQEEEEEEEDEEDDEEEAGHGRCPNLSNTNLEKSAFFTSMEQQWLQEFKERLSVPISDYDKVSQLGKINWQQYCLVESDDRICKGHHALCPQIRCRRTGQLYRCKIISSKRVHFNLTTLGFSPSEYKREITNALVERRLLFAFRHPFIRHGLGFFTDLHYNIGVFLEEFPHGTLLDYYEKREDAHKIVCHFTEEQVKYIAAQLILALEYLHTIGCVHRDVQAGNVLVDANGYLRLTDFAITAVLPQSGRLFDLTCFRYYAAPEYYSDKGYNTAVDIYALGLTLFELLTKECFSDQEEIFDYDGSVDWGLVPDDLASMFSGKQQDDGQSAAEAAKKINSGLPSAEARGFVDDCLIFDASYRPDRTNARFYDWFSDIDFEKLYLKQLQLPWKPDKVVSYQADVDEEYPLNLILDQTPMPDEFKQYEALFTGC